MLPAVRFPLFKALTVAAACLAFLIVVLGAYVRLNDAGLGCPDWPGCYGRLSVPSAPHELAQAQASYPTKPLVARKAWIEMLHRYFASGLGIVILTIAVIAWRKRDELRQSPRLASLLVALVILQGMLGMWTVTMLLKPAVVTAHLLGGMATLALLAWLARRQFERASRPRIIASLGLRFAAALALAILAIQIALGGWVSTNYAALACTDFPRCHGSWVPVMDWANAFHVVRELGMTAQGSALSIEALTAIHWVHRLGALATLIYIGWLGFWIFRRSQDKRYGVGLLLALGLQVLLGIANVVMNLPLFLAVAHNAGAALLLVALVLTNYQLNRPQKNLFV
jgi:heme a synthase